VHDQGILNDVRNIALTWQQAAMLGLALFAAAWALRRTSERRLRRCWPVAREAGVIALLYAMWQLAGTLSLLGTAGAFARGRWIVRTEHAWHLPSETDVQRLILPHQHLVEFCNLYYATMHFAALFAMLAWLFLLHRDQYPRVRTTVVLLTAGCLLIQFLPVAPPRLLPQYGYVDTATRYGQSVYGALSSAGTAGIDQLSAMPSVHVGWSVLVGLTVVQVGRRRWRWAAIMHPVVTIFVVVATGNHFWLDGIVAVALLAVALAIQRVADTARRRTIVDRSVIATAVPADR
jgi:hypothetical protein